MRNVIRLVVLGVLGVLVGLAPAMASAETGAAPLRLDVAASKSGYVSGEKVSLRFTLTNQGSAPCQVVAIADGTVDVTAATKDGKALTPTFLGQSHYFGYEQATSGALTTVNPGASTTFDLVGITAPGRGEDSMALPAADPTADGDSLVAMWPVAAEGSYSVSVAYTLAPIDGATPAACAGATSVATVAFTVGPGSPGFPWLWVILGAAGLLVLILIVLFLVRRGRTRAAAFAVLAILTAAGLTVTEPRQASAELIVGGAGTEFGIRANGCVSAFQVNDPAKLMDFLKDPNSPRVQILPREYDPELAKERDHYSVTRYSVSEYGGPQGSNVYWTPTSKNPDGTPQRFEHSSVDRDACSELYHELAHAFDAAKGVHNFGRCNENVKTNVAEVRATLAENQYRRNGGMPAHESYDGPPLPKSLSECKKKEEPPVKRGCTFPALTGQPLLSLNGSRRQRADCDAPPDDAAMTDGDPHLATFDKRWYDFQAVGEFVAARSTKDDLEIQTRQTAMPNDRTVSLNSAVALKVGADKVGFYLRDGDIDVHVNAASATPTRGDLKLSGGGTLKRRPSAVPNGTDGYTVRWPDGSAVWLDPIGRWGIRLFAKLANDRKGQVSGLLGNFDGNADNDLVTKDGKPIAAPPSFEQLYRTFGDSWRITQQESLFDYAAGESTEKFTDRAFPERELTIRDIPEEQRKSAKAACELAGVTNPALLDACILDVVTIGQPTFAVNAGETQNVVPSAKPTTNEPPPGPVNNERPLRDGDTVTGKLDAPGEQDVYQLDLGGATDFDFVDETKEISFEPEHPGLWRRALDTDAWRIAEDSPEAKKVVVTAPEYTGEYHFRVVTRKHRRFEVKLGDKIGPGGAAGTGRLDVPGRVDVYVFDSGSASSIDLADSRGCNYWVGVAEDNPEAIVHTPYPMWVDEPDGPCISTSIHVEPNTRYQLVVWSTEAKMLDYEFRITGRA